MIRRRDGRHPVSGTLRVAALSAALTIVLAACGAETSDDGPEAATGALDGTTRHEVMIDDRQRTWSLYSPSSTSVAPDGVPLLLVVHGTGDTGAGIRSGVGADLERLADRDGFAIAYVDGVDNNWNECRAEGDWTAKREGLDDVGVMRAVVDGAEAALEHGVDRDKVFALGFSSGGHMTMRLAHEAPDLVAGVAAVAANVPTEANQTCPTDGDAVPALFVQCREDPINPFDGGEVRTGSGPFGESRGEVLSALDGARWFAERNGAEPIGGDPVPERSGDAEIWSWAGEHPVRLVAVDDCGHSFPTASGRWGRDNGARFDAPAAAWDFFSTAVR